MSERTIDWHGVSGSTYRYWIYPLGTNFKNVPGNYIFAQENGDGQFTPIYIGQTSDLSERFDNHQKMPCIRRFGANCICAHTSSASEKERLTEEQDLIQKRNTSCNY